MIYGSRPERTRLRDRHPGSSLAHKLTYEVCRKIARLALTTTQRLRAHDLGNVPAAGPLLIVANHQSFLDPPCIGSMITHRHIEYLARATLWGFGPFGKLIQTLNSIPIAEGGDAAAMKEALRRLHEGKCVLVFPEGSRSPDGAMREFKRGAAVLVKRARCPVLPAAIEGAFDAWPRKSKYPKLFGPPVEVKYGTPIPHSQLLEGGADAALERLAAEVERLRLELHDSLRARTAGRYPTTPGRDTSTA
jgi:1-acyl-sn-glycerol-3-phosphate acyltransferase